MKTDSFFTFKHLHTTARVCFVLSAGTWSIWTDWGSCVSYVQTRSRTCTRASQLGCDDAGVDVRSCIWTHGTGIFSLVNRQNKFSSM